MRNRPTRLPNQLRSLLVEHMKQVKTNRPRTARPRWIGFLGETKFANICPGDMIFKFNQPARIFGTYFLATLSRWKGRSTIRYRKNNTAV
jgi:hypothetical protein